MTPLSNLITLVASKLSARVRDERGAIAVEYGVVAVFIAAVIVAAVFYLGASTNDSFNCTGIAYATSSTC